MIMQLSQAEAQLGENYVISRAMAWRASKYLCSVAGQRDPSQYWACAQWDEQTRVWIEPTLVFARLADLVAYYRQKQHDTDATAEVRIAPPVG